MQPNTSVRLQPTHKLDLQKTQMTSRKEQAGAEAEVSTPLEIRDLRFEIRD